MEEKNIVFRTIENKYGKLLVCFEPKGVVEAYEYLKWEPKNVDLIVNGNYDTFVDVGAAWGYFTRIAANHCRHVIAFEAQPIRFGFLLWNTKDFSNVECYYNFICDRRSRDPTMSGDFVRMVESGDKMFYRIEPTFLDYVFLDYLNSISPPRMLIKVDVEGNELNVLDGASNLINCEKVHWTIDIHTMVDEEEVFRKMKNKKYKILAENKVFFY